MARVDYHGILDELQAILVANSDLDRAKKFIESELWFGPDVPEGIYLYNSRRRAPAELQSLSRGRRQDYLLDVIIWCAGWHQDSVRDASKIRDALIGDVETTLMDVNDRTLNGKAKVYMLEGGELATFEDNGFLSTGQVLVTVHVQATI